VSKCLFHVYELRPELAFPRLRTCISCVRRSVLHVYHTDTRLKVLALLLLNISGCGPAMHRAPPPPPHKYKYINQRLRSPHFRRPHLKCMKSPVFQMFCSSFNVQIDLLVQPFCVLWYKILLVSSSINQPTLSKIHYKHKTHSDQFPLMHFKTNTSCKIIIRIILTKQNKDIENQRLSNCCLINIGLIFIQEIYKWYIYLWHFSERIHSSCCCVRSSFVCKTYTAPCALILY
jgi:hypothetical protein